MSKTMKNPTFTLSNGTVLELGPTLTRRVPWEDNRELEELNASLPQGEKHWRRPTDDEYQEIGAPILVIWKDPNLSERQKILKVAKYLKKNKWREDFYWSSTEVAGVRNHAGGWYSNGGRVYNEDKRVKDLVRLVR